jgi:predicted RNA-binding Zn-ribbon protein involved in translation (DUF1610 family)
MKAIDRAATAYPCPYCGTEQAYVDARPSRPRVVTIGGARETMYDTECRECGQRIVWSMRLGNGSIADLFAGKASYRWEKP